MLSVMVFYHRKRSERKKGKLGTISIIILNISIYYFESANDFSLTSHLELALIIKIFHFYFENIYLFILGHQEMSKCFIVYIRRKWSNEHGRNLCSDQ